MPKRLYTIKDASRILKVNEALLYKLIKTKKLEAIKIGQSFRIPKENLISFLKLKKLNPLYTISEASKILRVNKLTLYNLAKEKKVKIIRVGRFFRISGEAAFNYSLNQRFFTIEEAAKLFKINHISLRKFLAEKKIGIIKISALYRIPEQEILKFTSQEKIAPLLDIKEAQKKLNLSRLTILKLVYSKELAAFKIGRLCRITEAALFAYQKSQEEKYTVEKLSRILKVSASLIRKMIKKHEIKAKKIGREYIIPKEEIKKLLK